MATSYETWTAEAAQTLFPFTFSYLRTTDVYAYVDGTLATEYSINTSGCTIDAPVMAGGESVTIKRVTDVSTPITDFEQSGAITEENLDNAVLQLLYRSQELEDQLNSVETTGLDVPVPTDASQMVVSFDDGGNWAWKADDVDTVLETEAFPSADTQADNTFAVVSSDAWALSDLATTKTVLGIADSIVAASTGPNQFLKSHATDGSWDVVELSGLKTTLGLGEAAYLNEGTANGEVVILEDVSGSPGFPAVDGSQLTGIATQAEYALYTKTTVGVNDGTLFPSNPTQSQETPSSTWSASNASGIQITAAGRYLITVNVLSTFAATATQNLTLSATGGDVETFSGDNSSQYFIPGVAGDHWLNATWFVEVTTPNTVLSLVQDQDGATPFATVDELRFHIVKF